MKILINETETDKLEGDLELISWFIFFIINLFFRNPYNQLDQLKLLNFLKLDNKIIPQNPILDPDEQLKLIKLFAPFKLLSQKLKSGKWSYKIIDGIRELILTDNPIIFRKQPTTNDDFIDSFVMPLSKSRLFIGLSSNTYNIGIKELKTINLLSIFQAQNYVASSDRNFLEQIVTGYKHWKRIEFQIPTIKSDLFKSINKKTPDNKY